MFKGVSQCIPAVGILYFCLFDPFRLEFITFESISTVSNSLGKAW
jgi:hypothetical protein